MCTAPPTLSVVARGGGTVCLIPGEVFAGVIMGGEQGAPQVGSSRGDTWAGCQPSMRGRMYHAPDLVSRGKGRWYGIRGPLGLAAGHM